MQRSGEVDSLSIFHIDLTSSDSVCGTTEINFENIPQRVNAISGQFQAHILFFIGKFASLVRLLAPKLAPKLLCRGRVTAWVGNGAKLVENEIMA